MTANPFDWINSISFLKEDLIENGVDEKDYNPWMVNNGLSYYVDTLLYANEMNRLYDIPKYMQYKYLFNSIKKRKRFSKWEKKKSEDGIEEVSNHFKIGRQEAASYIKLIGKDRLKELLKALDHET